MNCGKCDGNCARCGGCGTMELTESEIRVLTELGRIPFWPIAGKAEVGEPVCPEMEYLDLKQQSLTLMCLEKKGLIELDWDMPLKGYDYGRIGGYPLRGSMALTLRGQRVVDLLEIQGVDG